MGEWEMGSVVGKSLLISVYWTQPHGVYTTHAPTPILSLAASLHSRNDRGADCTHFVPLVLSNSGSIPPPLETPVVSHQDCVVQSIAPSTVTLVLCYLATHMV